MIAHTKNLHQVLYFICGRAAAKAQAAQILFTWIIATLLSSLRQFQPVETVHT